LGAASGEIVGTAIPCDEVQRAIDRHVTCLASDYHPEFGFVVILEVDGGEGDAVAGGAQAIRELSEDHRRCGNRHVGLDRMAAIVEPNADDLLGRHDDRGKAQALHRDERTGWRPELRGKRRDITERNGCRSLPEVRGREILDAAVKNETSLDAF
jgi:hypothetical protein